MADVLQGLLGDEEKPHLERGNLVRIEQGGIERLDVSALELEGHADPRLLGERAGAAAPVQYALVPAEHVPG